MVIYCLCWVDEVYVYVSQLYVVIRVFQKPIIPHSKEKIGKVEY